jgi:hypothetical protein
LIFGHKFTAKKKLLACELSIDKMLAQEECVAFFSSNSAIKKWANKPLKSLI